MPCTAKVETWSGEMVRVEIEDGRQYRKRVELSYDDRRVVYGIVRDRGEPVAEFVVYPVSPYLVERLPGKSDDQLVLPRLSLRG